MHAIMFHHFHDGKNFQPFQGSVSEQEFREIIEYYRSKGYRFLKARDWYQKAISNRIDEKEVVITFDDGLKCQTEIGAKVLEELGLTGFFFIPSYRFVGKIEYLELFREFRSTCFTDVEEFYTLFLKHLKDSPLNQKYDFERRIKNMDFSQYLTGYDFYSYEDKLFRFLRDDVLSEEEYHEKMLELMKNYEYDVEENFNKLYMKEEDLIKLSQKDHVVGLHSHSHYTNLASTSYQRQKIEYSLNKEILEGIIGTEIEVAAYPCNACSQDTVKVMKELGVKVAFRTNMEKEYSHLLEIPRCDHTTIFKELSKNRRNYGKSV